MGDSTGIEWTDATWNPVRGCSRVSEGCMRCYAERVAARFSGPGQPYEGLIRIVSSPSRAETDSRYSGSFLEESEVIARRWNGVVRLVPEHLADPLRWKKPRRIFVNSMSDLFHEKLTNGQIAAVFGVMAAAPQHTFQVLTKRARRMREWFEWAEKHGDGQDLLRFGPSALLTCAWEACSGDAWGDVEPPGKLESLPSADVFGKAWPLPNVTIGVSVEDRKHGVPRIDELRDVPAAVRMLSIEPLLEDVGTLDLRGIGWVVVGCESGPGARPCDVAWLRSLRDQCAVAGVPFFLKQAVECNDDRFWEVEIGGDDFVSVKAGPGSHRKPGGIIGAPYLDGVQHLAFPEVRRG